MLFYYPHIGEFDILSIGISLPPDRVLFVVIVTIFFFCRNSLEKEKSISGTFEFLIVFFALMAIGSYLYVLPDNHLPAYRHLVTLLSLIVYPFVIFHITKRIPYNRKNCEFILWTFVIIGIYLSITAIGEHYKLTAFVYPQYIMDPNVGKQFGRARGPFVEAAFMGRALNAIIFITFLMSIFASRINRLFLKFIVFISVVSLYFTYTRGPWVGFALGLMSLFLWKEKLRKYSFRFLLVLAILVCSGVGSKLAMHGTSLFAKRHHTLDNREVAVKGGLRMAKENILLGIGFGRFNAEWSNYFQEDMVPISEKKFYFDGNHNTFVGIFAELGIIGLVIYLSIFYNMFKISYITYKKLNNDNYFEKYFVIIFIAMFISYIFTSNFIDSRYHPFDNSIIFLLFGFVCSINKGKCTSQFKNSSRVDAISRKEHIH